MTNQSKWCILFLLLFTAQVAMCDNLSLASQLKPNVIGTEILGRGGLYGVFYDRSVSDYVSLGFGFSHYFSNLHQTSTSVIPVYSNFYSTLGQHRAYFTAGVSYLRSEATSRREEVSYPSLFSDSEKLDSMQLLLPSLGGGYELRFRWFLSRFTFYYILIPTARAGTVGVPWGGLSFGGVF